MSVVPRHTRPRFYQRRPQRPHVPAESLVGPIVAGDAAPEVDAKLSRNGWLLAAALRGEVVQAASEQAADEPDVDFDTLLKGRVATGTEAVTPGASGEVAKSTVVADLAAALGGMAVERRTALGAQTLERSVVHEPQSPLALGPDPRLQGLLDRAAMLHIGPNGYSAGRHAL